MKAICFGFLIGALGFAGEQSVFAQDKEMAVNVGGRPNIVVLITDDQNQSDLGCYGNSDVRTPNMDSLASEGMRFTSAYADRKRAVTGRMVPVRVDLGGGRIIKNTIIKKIDS